MHIFTFKEFSRLEELKKEIEESNLKKLSVFVDEFTLQGDSLSTMLESLTTTSNKLEYLWVAPHSDSQTKLFKKNENLQEKVKKFHIINLEYNLRNGQHINKYADGFKFTKKEDKETFQPLLGRPLTNFPEGKRPEHLKSLSEAISYFKINKSQKGILVIYKFKDKMPNIDCDIQFQSGTKLNF